MREYRCPPDNVRKLVRDAIKKLRQISNDIFSVDFQVLINYKITKNNDKIILGRAIKYANRTMRTIELNYDFLMKDPVFFVNEVLSHEYAHHVIYTLEDRNGLKYSDPHGKEFIDVCSYFGIVGKSHMDFDYEC